MRAAAALPPAWRDREEYLLQVRHRGEVKVEGGDERGVAPPRGIAGGRDNSVRIAGQDAALDLRQVGVVVAQIQGEYLPREGETDVPGRVVGEVDRRIEHERDQIGGAEPVMSDLSRKVPADFVDQPERERIPERRPGE